MSEREVHTLSSMEGRKDVEWQGKTVKEAIANHGKSLVFLPLGTPTNRSVRVFLLEIRADSRGHMMYRGIPAPDVASERWKDNGDGTASRVTILTDWLGEESELGVVETRQLATREAAHTTRSDYRIVWGNSLVTSVVEDHQVEVIPTEQEYVFNNTLQWKKVGERTESRPVFSFAITELRVNNANMWWMARYEAVWKPELAILGEVFFRTSGEQVLRTALVTTYGAMPDWWKQEQEAKFPVCSCGRKRCDVQTSDGYTKCEQCRKEEHCSRCNQQKTVQLVAGKLLCTVCKPLEEQDDLVVRLLTSDHRASIAAEAKKLGAGQALEKDAGTMILEATMGHISDNEYDMRRREIEQHWRSQIVGSSRVDRQWFYFCEDGTYGTIYAPAALQLLEYVPIASGDGLLELIGWVVQPMFYYSTQVEGRAGQIQRPLLTDAHLRDLVGWLNAGKPVLADRLRGSEADRIASVEGFARLSEKLGKDHKEVKQVAEILKAQEQDYAVAVALIQKSEQRIAQRQAAIDAGEIWADVRIDVSTRSRVRTYVHAIGSDGLIIDPVEERTGGRRSTICAYAYGDLPNSALVVAHGHDDYGYQWTEDWTVHHLPTKVSEAQRTTLKRLVDETRYYFSGPGTGWDLRKVGTITFSTAYHRDFQGMEADLDNQMCSALPIDTLQWEQSVADNGTIVVGPYRRRSKEVKAVQQAEDAELEARGIAMALGYEKEEAQAAYDEALAVWADRDSIKDGSRPVEDGTVFLVPAFVKEAHKGGEQLVYGPFFDWASGTQVKLVLDSYSHASEKITEQNRDVLVRVRPRSGSELPLFVDFLRPQGGGHKQKTFGYFAIPVLSPDDFDRQIAEAEADHAIAVQALDRARHAAEYATAKKRAEIEEVRTIAEEPKTFYSSSAESLNSLAGKLKAALEGKSGK